MKNPLIKSTRAFGLILGIVGLLVMQSCEDTVDVPKYGILEGTVLDAETLQPMEGVSISTSPASSVLLTDADGSFDIEKIETGEYSISAKKAGYQTTSVSASVLENETTSVTITLEEGNSNTADLTVTPSPITGSTGQSRDVTLQWSLSRSYSSPTYDVIFFSANDPTQMEIASGISDTFLEVSDLNFETTYYWQITVYNGESFIANSETFSFQTTQFPDNDFRFVKMVDGSYEIFSSSMDSMDLIQLTNNETSAEVYPRLNPQRDMIAFTSNRGLNFNIYTMDRRGENQTKVTSLGVEGNYNNGIGYCWSPDGGKFLYSNFDKLYTIDRNGTDRRRIATAPTGRHFRMVDWTEQNGGKIVVQTMGADIYNSEIYIMDEDGSNMQLLISNVPGRVESPSFSIDGKRVLYTWDRGELNAADGRQIDARIYSMNTDSTNVVDLSIEKPAGTNDLYPRYSPTGARVIFVNTPNTGQGEPSVYMMDLDGDNRTKLFDMATFPDWF